MSTRVLASLTTCSGRVPIIEKIRKISIPRTSLKEAKLRGSLSWKIKTKISLRKKLKILEKTWKNILMQKLERSMKILMPKT